MNSMHKAVVIASILSTLPACASGSDRIQLNINSAEAVSCQKSCKGVTLELSVTNNTDRPICFSIRYINRIAGAIFIGKGDAKYGDSFLVNPEALDTVPNTPDNSEEYVKMLKSEPNIYVERKSTLTYRVNTGDRFDIPKSDLKATIGMYAYGCSDSTYQRISASAPLWFPK
jgi:hypothetical protein